MIGMSVRWCENCGKELPISVNMKEHLKTCSNRSHGAHEQGLDQPEIR